MQIVKGIWTLALATAAIVYIVVIVSTFASKLLG